MSSKKGKQPQVDPQPSNSDQRSPLSSEEGKQRQPKTEPVDPALETQGLESLSISDSDPHDDNAERIEESIVWENIIHRTPNPHHNSKRNKYYCVYNGRKIGIFDSWAETRSQVSGFPHQCHEAFKSLAEAKAAYTQALMNGSLGPPKTTAVCYVVLRGKRPGVYPTKDRAIRAMGKDPRADHIQVGSMQEGDTLFREKYMAGSVVALKNASV